MRSWIFWRLWCWCFGYWPCSWNSTLETVTVKNTVKNMVLICAHQHNEYHSKRGALRLAGGMREQAVSSLWLYGETTISDSSQDSRSWWVQVLDWRARCGGLGQVGVCVSKVNSFQSKFGTTNPCQITEFLWIFVGQKHGKNWVKFGNLYEFDLWPFFVSCIFFF